MQEKRPYSSSGWMFSDSLLPFLKAWKWKWQDVTATAPFFMWLLRELNVYEFFTGVVTVAPSGTQSFIRRGGT